MISVLKYSLYAKLPLWILRAKKQKPSPMDLYKEREQKGSAPVLYNYFYDYPFSTPTKNAVNKRIIERHISSPTCGGGKIYAKNLKFCIAAVFVVCQRDNHI